MQSARRATWAQPAAPERLDLPQKKGRGKHSALFWLGCGMGRWLSIPPKGPACPGQDFPLRGEESSSPCCFELAGAGSGRTARGSHWGCHRGPPGRWEARPLARGWHAGPRGWRRARSSWDGHGAAQEPLVGPWSPSEAMWGPRAPHGGLRGTQLPLEGFVLS